MLIKAAAIAAALAIALFFGLGLVVVASAMGTAETTAAQSPLNTAKIPPQYVKWVEEAGAECSAVSAPQIAAQIQQESDWNPHAVSNKGAEGIAQFRPGTWPEYGRPDAPGPLSPFNPGDAIMAMGRYDCAISRAVAGVPGRLLSNMLAGYNAGIQAVLDAGGVPPFPETQQYVADIEALIPQFEIGTPVVGGAFAETEIAAAAHYLGTPYVWGGGNIDGPTTGLPGSVAGFDCSGLVLYAVYQASGGKITLPHSSELMATMGTAVPRSQLQPGDVIAIQVDPGDYSHTVIYIGGGMVIQAPQPGQNVDEVPLNDFNGLMQAIRWFGG
ncbi:MAG: NlpC/P60 family protein [Streptosporangiaceae bacterium]